MHSQDLRFQRTLLIPREIPKFLGDTRVHDDLNVFFSIILLFGEKVQFCNQEIYYSFNMKYILSKLSNYL